MNECMSEAGKDQVGEQQPGSMPHTVSTTTPLHLNDTMYGGRASLRASHFLVLVDAGLRSTSSMAGCWRAHTHTHTVHQLQCQRCKKKTGQSAGLGGEEKGTVLIYLQSPKHVP
jgi:hypothetical protein